MRLVTGQWSVVSAVVSDGLCLVVVTCAIERGSSSAPVDKFVSFGRHDRYLPLG